MFAVPQLVTEGFPSEQKWKGLQAFLEVLSKPAAYGLTAENKKENIIKVQLPWVVAGALGALLEGACESFITLKTKLR